MDYIIRLIVAQKASVLNLELPYSAAATSYFAQVQCRQDTTVTYKLILLSDSYFCKTLEAFYREPITLGPESLQSNVAAQKDQCDGTN